MIRKAGFAKENGADSTDNDWIIHRQGTWGKHKDFLLILLVLILLRIPAILVWSPYTTGSDAAIYMETAMNLAEGKGFVHSICRYTPDLDRLRDYVAKFGNRTQEIKRPPIYIYALSGIYLLTGKSNFMTGINLFNLLLFVLTVWLFYRHLLFVFPDNRFVQNLSVLWLGTSFTWLEYSFGAWMESCSLFFFVLALFLHVRLISKEMVKPVEMLVHGVALSLLALSKHSVVIFVVAFLLHLLWKKQFRFFLLSGITVLILAGSWYILRDMLMQGRVLAKPTHEFPFSGTIIPTNFFTYFVKLLTDRPVNVFRQLVETTLNLNNLGLVAPFLIGFFARKSSPHRDLAVFLCVAPVLTYLLYGYVLPRYFFPAFIPLIPAALLAFQDYMLPWSKTTRFFSLMAVLVITLVFRISDIVKFYAGVYLNGIERRELFCEADKVLSKAGVKNTDMLLTNIVGYNVYSEVGYALLPPYLERSHRNELLDLYNIDYVLFYVGNPRPLDWADLTDYVDSFNDLLLVGKSDRLNYLRLYKIER